MEILFLFLPLITDINQSGEIDRKDFELAINVRLNVSFKWKRLETFDVFILFLFLLLQKICNLRGWPEGHAKNKETHDAMFKIWDGLRTKADEDNDGQVSQMVRSV